MALGIEFDNWLNSEQAIAFIFTQWKCTVAVDFIQAMLGQLATQVDCLEVEKQELHCRVYAASRQGDITFMLAVDINNDVIILAANDPDSGYDDGESTHYHFNPYQQAFIVP